MDDVKRQIRWLSLWVAASAFVLARICGLPAWRGLEPGDALDFALMFGGLTYFTLRYRLAVRAHLLETNNANG